MIVDSKLEVEIVNNGIIEKYFRNRHVLLIYLASREGVGNLPTVITIKKAFKITKKYTWALLEKLESDKLIKKSEKVALEGKEYYSYILTSKARQELKTLLSCLRRYCANL